MATLSISEQEAYNNGYQAGLAGYTGYNPYKVNTPEYKAWGKGWGLGYEAAVRELKKSVKGT